LDVSAQLRDALRDRYRIEGEIGAGGMATVYLAEDIRHRRRVALKVLRPELAAVLGPDRFLSEINVTANLQHPHLLALFDSGEAEGLLFYVMPYIEGESLRHRLERERQLPVDDAVRLAVSIASALDYAHRHGVIHRDLKPENILLHDGQPLVADFGIALAVSNAGGSRVTQTGLSLGTPQYMSPEQATGDRVIDGRSDIYSLAAILYEMLSGEPPHSAATTQGVIAKLLTEKPPSVRTYRDAVPEHVDLAIQMGLAKLAADRFATASDFAAALTGERVVVPRISAAAAKVEDATRPRTRRRMTQLLLLALGVLVTAALAAAMLRTPPLSPRTPAFMPIALGDSMAYVSYGGISVALSREGTHLAFTGTFGTTNGILLRTLDGPNVEFIRGSEGGISPVFSPDGQWIAFLRSSQLFKVPLTGGPAVLLADSGASVVDWSGDGYVYFHSVGSRISGGILRVPQDGGVSEVVSSPDTARGHRLYRYLHVLPGERHALVTLYRDGTALSDAELGVMRLRDGVVNPLDIRGTSARYVRSGHIVFARSDGSVYAAPFSLRRRRITGELVRVVENVVTGTGGKADIAVSANGSFAFGQGGSRGRNLIATNGTVVRTLSQESAGFGAPRVSPDGRRIALGIYDQGADMWIMDAGSGSLTRLTTGTGDDAGAWTHDGRRVASIISEADTSISIQQWDGSGATEQLSVMPQMSELSFDATGRVMLLRSSGASGNRNIYTMSTDSPGVIRPFLATPADERSPALSPDGSLIAYSSDETGSHEVYVRPFPGPGGRVRISSQGGETPTWSRNGDRLYYRSRTHMMSATITRSPELTKASEQALFEDAYYRTTTRQYDMLPSGEFLMIQTLSGGGSLNLIVNWDRRLVKR